MTWLIDKQDNLITQTSKSPIHTIEDKPECPSCGMVLDKVMHFSCSDMNCPVQAKIVYK